MTFAAARVLLTMAAMALTSCAAASDRIENRFWPTSPRELAVYVHVADDPFLRIMRMVARVGDGEEHEIVADGEPFVVRLPPGTSRLEVTGAFQYCAFEHCNGASPMYRRTQVDVSVGQDCAAVARVDVCTEPRPAHWPVEAPMIDVRVHRRCELGDPEALAVVRQASGHTTTTPEAPTASASSGPVVEIGAPESHASVSSAAPHE
jgi:hypothetical protein